MPDSTSLGFYCLIYKMQLRVPFVEKTDEEITQKALLVSRVQDALNKWKLAWLGKAEYFSYVLP